MNIKEYDLIVTWKSKGLWIRPIGQLSGANANHRHDRPLVPLYLTDTFLAWSFLYQTNHQHRAGESLIIAVCTCMQYIEITKMNSWFVSFSFGSSSSLFFSRLTKTDRSIFHWALWLHLCNAFINTFENSLVKKQCQPWNDFGVSLALIWETLLMQFCYVCNERECT